MFAVNVLHFIDSSTGAFKPGGDAMMVLVVGFVCDALLLESLVLQGITSFYSARGIFYLYDRWQIIAS